MSEEGDHGARVGCIVGKSDIAGDGGVMYIAVGWQLSSRDHRAFICWETLLMILSF